MNQLKPIPYDLNRIKDHLHWMGFTVFHFESIDSTNEHIKNHPEYLDLTLIIADEQSAGRGRQARTFESKKDVGLYTSIVIKRNYDAQNIAWLSLMCGQVIAEVLSQYTLKSCQVKWPNDVLINKKKVAGILVEHLGDGRIIVGFGINLFPQAFDPSFQDRASFLTQDDSVDKNLILIEIYQRLVKIFKQPYCLEHKLLYEEKLSMNKVVIVQSKHHHYSARVLGVSDFGLLMVEDEKGKIHHLSSEDIHLVSK